jgi:YggT family protein
MNSSYFGNAGLFLVNTLFGIYIVAVILRVLLQLVHADFYNPICQALVRVTNPLLIPLRRIIPPVGQLDMAAVVLVFGLKLVQLWLAGKLVGQTTPLLAMLVFAVAALLQTLTTIFTVTIVAQVILSWIDPAGQNPVGGLLRQLNAPLVNPVRRNVPAIGGLDLSPLLVILALQLAGILIIAPIFDLARNIAAG